MRFVQRLFKYKWLINFYPPFIGAGVSLKEYSPQGNRYLVQMKLRWYNRNVYGSHFGGSLYSMCDPWFVFAAYSYFGDEYVILDKSASIKFVAQARGRVEALFEISLKELEEMKSIVDSKGKQTFEFVATVLDAKGNTIATVDKEIYIRKKS